MYEDLTLYLLFPKNNSSKLILARVMLEWLGNAKVNQFQQCYKGAIQFQFSMTLESGGQNKTFRKL